MKKHTITYILIATGLATLFFFPKPQQNFLWYVLTALMFVGLIWWINKK
jgi:type IV secretory pathway TrbL component